MQYGCATLYSLQSVLLPLTMSAVGKMRNCRMRKVKMLTLSVHELDFLIGSLGQDSVLNILPTIPRKHFHIFEFHILLSAFRNSAFYQWPTMSSLLRSGLCPVSSNSNSFTGVRVFCLELGCGPLQCLMYTMCPGPNICKLAETSSSNNCFQHASSSNVFVKNFLVPHYLSTESPIFVPNPASVNDGVTVYTRGHRVLQGIFGN